MERVLNLQATQEEMMKKLSLIESDGIISSSAENSHVTSPKMDKKKIDATSSTAAKRHRWKNWGWKHNQAKSHSIEEEPSPDSPRISQPSSKSSTPNNSPKHKYKPIVDVNANVDENMLPFRRIKKQTNNAKIDSKTKSEIRSSAGARLFTMHDGKDDVIKSDETDEFSALLSNGRPASIHIIQSDKKDEF
jgi:hypothetical protein